MLGDGSITEVGTSFCEALLDIQSIGSCQDPLLDKLANGGGAGGTLFTCTKLLTIQTERQYHIVLWFFCFFFPTYLHFTLSVFLGCK